MLDKPLNRRMLLLVALCAALIYIFIAGLVNIKLLQDLLSAPISVDTLTAALARADGCFAPWVIAMVAICLIGGTCFRGGAFSGSASWDDDEDCLWHHSSADDHRVNPATGLVMVGAVDVGGHAWNCSD